LFVSTRDYKVNEINFGYYTYRKSGSGKVRDLYLSGAIFQKGVPGDEISDS